MIEIKVMDIFVDSVNINIIEIIPVNDIDKHNDVIILEIITSLLPMMVLKLLDSKNKKSKLNIKRFIIT